MSLVVRDRCALVLVDFQARLMPAIHDGDAVVAYALVLADVARELAVPVVGTAQNPRGLGDNVVAIAERCDRMVEKMHFNACADGLLEALHEVRGDALGEVVVAGCEAHVCLLQTAIGLVDAGLKVWLVADACGSRRASSHAVAMRRLQQAGAIPVTTESVAFEWLRTCEDEHFRAVLARLKQLPV